MKRFSFLMALVAMLFLSGCAGMELHREAGGFTVTAGSTCQGASCVLSAGGAGPLAWWDREARFSGDALTTTEHPGCAPFGAQHYEGPVAVRACIDYDRKVRVGGIEQPFIGLWVCGSQTCRVVAPSHDEMSFKRWRAGRDAALGLYAIYATGVLGGHGASSAVAGGGGGGVPAPPPPPGP